MVGAGLPLDSAHMCALVSGALRRRGGTCPDRMDLCGWVLAPGTLGMHGTCPDRMLAPGTLGMHGSYVVKCWEAEGCRPKTRRTLFCT